MKRKTTCILVVILAAAALLAGCAAPAPSPSPSPTATIMPTTQPPAPTNTLAPSGTGPIGTGTPSAALNKAASEAVQTEVEKLSEVDKSYAVVVGTEALVGLEFTAQYQGGVTDRIREMVDEKAKAADNTITKVVVTDVPEQVAKIEEMLKSSGESVRQEFDNLLNELEKPA